MLSSCLPGASAGTLIAVQLQNPAPEKGKRPAGPHHRMPEWFPRCKTACGSVQRTWICVLGPANALGRLFGARGSWPLPCPFLAYSRLLHWHQQLIFNMRKPQGSCKSEELLCKETVRACVGEQAWHCCAPHSRGCSTPTGVLAAAGCHVLVEETDL